MAKRFTDTNKWRKDFIRGLQGAYKLLWIYILDECDHAGIWHVELDVASMRLGFEYKREVSIKEFGDRIIIFDNNTKWFIPDFIEFQYGILNPGNRAHKSVLDLLEKYKLKGHLRGLQARKDMDKVKDSYIEVYNKVKCNIEIPESFESLILLWLKYKSEKKQSYKLTGLESFVKSVLKNYKTPDELKEAVEYSMSKNYDGLFNKKQEHGKSPESFKDVNDLWPDR